MIEVLTYIVVAIIAFFAGRGSRTEPPPVIDNQLEELQKEIKYYKELCLWHVKEKEKLKRNEPI